MAPRILMCPPTHYGIQYEINPWMDTRRRADHRVAQSQWAQLRQLVEQAGAIVDLLDPQPDLPDLVFTANAALIFERRAILSRFRYPQRQREEPCNAAWLEEHGFRVQRLPREHYFEGAGDALFCGDTLFAGYHFRSQARSLQEVGQMIDCRVVPLELVDPYYYHLDTCFCPLTVRAAIYFPGAFDEYGRQVLRELVPQLIEVEAEEARHFACNAVVVGRTVITNTGCPGLHARLNQLQFEPRETPLSEYVKAGGSAKCLTLRLDGEEAAGWRQNRSGEAAAAAS